MSIIGKAGVIEAVRRICDIIIANEIPFCDLDSAAGDGDFGMSLAKGFREVRDQWATLDTADIGAFLKSCGMIVTEHCGGASGPIWGSAFRAMGRYANGKDSLTLHEFGEMLEAAVEAIQKRGGAKLGDKTLLDALIPAAGAIRAAALEGKAIAVAFEEARAAAVAGAEATRLIAASKGRASYLGARSVSFPDAGATAIGVIASQLLVPE
jgi:dihydroxyacetone kinase